MSITSAQSGDDGDGAIEDGLGESSPSSELQERPGAAFDRVVGNLVNSGLSAWLTTVTGSPDSGAAIGGMVGPIAEEVSFAFRRILGLQTARGTRMIEQAAVTSGTTPPDFLDRLLEDPFKVELLLRAMEAAGRSTTEAKLDLISDLLATGALTSDRPVVQEQLLALEAIRSLDVPHFRLLVLLNDPTPAWWDGADRARFRHAWSEEKIVDRDPGLTNALANLAAKLTSLGMIRDVGSASGHGILWELTRFGKTCIVALRGKGLNDDE